MSTGHNDAGITKDASGPVLARPVSLLGHSASSVVRRMAGNGRKPLDSSAPDCLPCVLREGCFHPCENGRGVSVSPRAHLTSVCRWHLSCRATLQRPVARLEKAVSTQSHCAAREGAEGRSCQTHHHDEPAVLLVSRVADRHPRNNPISPPADHTESAAREELLETRGRGSCGSALCATDGPVGPCGPSLAAQFLHGPAGVPPIALVN